MPVRGSYFLLQLRVRVQFGLRVGTVIYRFLRSEMHSVPKGINSYGSYSCSCEPAVFEPALITGQDETKKQLTGTPFQDLLKA